MIFKSKQVLTATLIVALGAAVAVNWYYTNSPDMTSDESVTTQAVSGNLGDSLYVGATTASDSQNSSSDKKSSESTDKSADEYFANAKLKRKQSHDEIIDNIEDMVENEDVDSDTKNRISILLSDFKDDIKAETDTENLITAKIGSECIVIINNGTCQVVLEKNTLNDLLILQITEIIEKNTEISSENLTIIEAK